MKPDNTKFDWEKHSHIEPLTDDEFEKLKARWWDISLSEKHECLGSILTEDYDRLIATVEALRDKLMKQSHALFELKQEQKRLKSIIDVLE